MEDGKRGRSITGVPGTPDVDTGELLSEIRDLLSRHPALQYAGAEKAGRALRALRGVRADVYAVEAVLEALRSAWERVRYGTLDESPRNNQPRDPGVWTGVKLGCGMFIVLPIIIFVLMIFLFILAGIGGSGGKFCLRDRKCRPAPACR